MMSIVTPRPFRFNFQAPLHVQRAPQPTDPREQSALHWKKESIALQHNCCSSDVVEVTVKGFPLDVEDHQMVEVVLFGLTQWEPLEVDRFSPLGHPHVWRVFVHVHALPAYQGLGRRMEAQAIESCSFPHLALHSAPSSRRQQHPPGHHHHQHPGYDDTTEHRRVHEKFMAVLINGDGGSEDDTPPPVPCAAAEEDAQQIPAMVMPVCPDPIGIFP